MKNHSIPVKANASMYTNAKAMGMQSKLKTAELDEEALKNVLKCNKLWSNLPTSEFLTPYAEGLMHSIIDRDGLYEAKRVGEREFEILCNVLMEPFLEIEEEKDCPVPKFSRLRRVHIDNDGICRCSCCYYERVGMPCPHMASVFLLINEKNANDDWEGFQYFQSCSLLVIK